MPEDESNPTLQDFGPSNDDEVTDEDVTGDAGGVADDDDGDSEAKDGAVTDDGDGAREAEDEGSGTVVADVASVQSAVSTSRFVPDGESCASCETSMRRLWLVDGDAVCADCKAW